jgi:hypothetical protein
MGETGREVLDWINWPQDRDTWWAFVNTVMKHRGSINTRPYYDHLVNMSPAPSHNRASRRSGSVPECLWIIL